MGTDIVIDERRHLITYVVDLLMCDGAVVLKDVVVRCASGLDELLERGL
jgi:hypothetical protein